MTVKQISLITMKSGEKVNLPDSLNEAEICFTNDTGEVFIGAPNFGPVQYRSDQTASTNGQGISPYRNIKILTEFDVTQTITGDSYTQGPLVNLVLPISPTPSTLYTFETGINSVIASLSLYDGANVNMVADLYIATFGGQATVCMAGMKNPGIVFSAQLVNNSIILEATNTTNSIYTMYMSARCWQSSLASWDGAKGQGSNPICYAGAGDGSGNGSGTGGGSGVGYLSKLLDVNLNTLQGGQFLKFDSSQNKWINANITYGDIGGDAPEGKTYLKDLLDVSLITDGSSTSLADGQALVYNASLSKWQNKNVSAKSLDHIITKVTTSGSTKADSASSNGDIIFITVSTFGRTNSITSYTTGNVSFLNSDSSTANTNFLFDGADYDLSVSKGNIFLTQLTTNTSYYTMSQNMIKSFEFYGGTGTGASISCNVGLALGAQDMAAYASGYQIPLSTSNSTYKSATTVTLVVAPSSVKYIMANNQLPWNKIFGTIDITTDSSGYVTSFSNVKLSNSYFTGIPKEFTGSVHQNTGSIIMNSATSVLITPFFGILTTDYSSGVAVSTIEPVTAGVSVVMNTQYQMYISSIAPTPASGGNNYTVGDQLYFPKNANLYWKSATLNSITVTGLTTVPTSGMTMPSPIYDGEILTLINTSGLPYYLYAGNTPMDLGTSSLITSRILRMMYGGVNFPYWTTIQSS